MHWNSVAIIFNDDLVAHAGLMLDGYLTIWSIELNAVIDQVGQHSFKPPAVSINFDTRRHSIHQRYFAGLRFCCERRDTLVDDLSQLDVGRTQSHVAALN